jgi:tetratricopeptide (TPR) repeat protein
MRRYTLPLFIIGVLVIISIVVSWFIYPEWRNDPAGLIGLIVVAIGGTFAFVKGGMDILKAWDVLQKREKIWDESPLRKTSPEIIREGLGRGGQVSYINRGTTDENLLWQHPKVIIIGQMNVGKTREAAEVIQRAIDDDLVPEDRIFEPSQTLRALDSASLEDALLWELDTGQKALLFIDDLPKDIIEGEDEKWDELLETLKKCPDYYVVATGRSDQLTTKQRKWLEKEGFCTIELIGLNDKDVDRLALAAAGVFGLRLSEEARKTFVDRSDGRPETTLIGLRRLAGSKIREVNEGQAGEVAKDSLEIAWMKTIRYLEDEHPGIKYCLDSIGTFHAANVHKPKEMVRLYARTLWKKEKRWQWKRIRLLTEAFDKLRQYDIKDRNGILMYPEVAVEDRIEKEVAEINLAKFLLVSRRFWRLPIIKKLDKYKRSHAWTLFDLATVVDDEKRKEALIDAAIKLFPYFGFYINRGIRYAEGEEHEQAIKDFNKAVELNSEYAVAYYNRGVSYTDLGKHTQALKEYDKAIELNPRYSAAYSNRGNLYTKLRKHEKAMDDFDKAIKLNPKDEAAYVNRGNSYANLGQYEWAIKDYDKAIELNPGLAQAYTNRGISQDEIGNHEQAIEDHTKSINLNPKYAAAYINRGSSYVNLGKHKRAIEDYDKAIELNPESEQAYSNRGNCYSALGLYEKGMEDHNKAIELNSEYTTAYVNRGNSYAHLGKFDLAIKEYNKAIKLNPADAVAYSNRGYIYAKLNKYERAIENYNEAIQLSPEYAEAYSNRAISFAELGEFELALVDYDKAIELNPAHAAIYSGRGVIYAILNKHERAIEDFNKAIELNAEYKEVYSNRGASYADLGEHERALEDYEKAIELKLEVPAVYYNKACSYALLGKKKKTLECLKVALTKDKSYCRLLQDNSDFDGIREEKAFIELIEEFCE